MSRFSDLFLGQSRNPMSPETRRNIALIAFLAWVGLGSDGLSSANYGPEEAFKALGAAGIKYGFDFNHFLYLGFYLAIATAVTVFIISLAYNQVIELFPNGGGGYKVANQLLHPVAGLVSGSALIIDYILTIAISVAAATDAVFNLVPQGYHVYRLPTEIIAVLFLTWLNIRGMKESIKVLLPIFLGFVIVHFGFIIFGIAFHANELPGKFHQAFVDTHSAAQSMGWFALIVVFMQAYSLGGGTYTGLEAVSNNVNNLAEPRVRTGKWTMHYMALSLSLIAGGIILLYLLYGVVSVGGPENQTYNGIVLKNMMMDWGWSFWHPVLVVTLLFEAGILFIGANTGFFGGPAVLANMAVDNWVPQRFRHLSSRLVKQNGVLLFGLGALVILLLTDGRVDFLVVLYSTNVFLTFSITLFGLCKHWITQRQKASHWKRRLLLSIIGFLVCGSILLIILVSKFTEGGWLTVVVTTAVIFLCYFTRRYYDRLIAQLNQVDDLLTQTLPAAKAPALPLDPKQPTAVFFVSGHVGEGMHTLFWTQKLFPNLFKNYIFIRVGLVDVQSYGGEEALKHMQEDVGKTLEYFVDYSHYRGIPARSYASYGTDAVSQLANLADKVSEEFPESVFFAGSIVSNKDSWLVRILHNETALAVQRKLLFSDKRMVILPMRV